MLFIELNTVETVTKLTKLCEKYKTHCDMEVDICYGRLVLDGCSLLGVMSAMGKIVKVIPFTNDNTAKEKFSNELYTLGGFDSEEEMFRR